MIVTFDYIDKNRDKIGKIVATSGGFDPIHPGHISCFEESKQFGHALLVIVNGDNFLRMKKGKSFMCLEDRCRIVDAIIHVDYTVPFEIVDDDTCIEAIKKIKPAVFTKGGDRLNKATIPEWPTCVSLGIEIKTNVGSIKRWSSSKYLDDWVAHRSEQLGLK